MLLYRVCKDRSRLEVWTAVVTVAWALLFSGRIVYGQPQSPLPSSSPSTAQEEYRRAEALVRNHQWDEGLTVLQPLLQRDPENVKAINLSALALTGKGDLAGANEYLEKALKIDPGFVPALKNLGITEFNAKQPVEAERHLLLALKASPDDPVVNLYLGQIYFARQNYAGVAAALPKAGPFLARDPNLAARLAISYLSLNQQREALGLLDKLSPETLTPELQFVLGVKLAEAELFARAIPFLQAARESRLDSYDADYDLTLCYLNVKQYPRAIELLRAEIGRGHETAELDNLLADAYEGNKDTQSAIDALRNAIALAPNDEDSYLAFASLCIDHQDLAAGLKVLNVALPVHPRSERLLLERAILYAMQDNFALAEEDFQQVVALSPGRDSAYKGLGVLYLETGNAAQAVQILRKRLEEKPNDPELLYLFGEATLRAGARMGAATYHEAQAAFERSVKLNPDSSLPRVALGKMYLQQDQPGEAVAQLERAHAIDPKEKSACWQLALAYRKLGQTDKQKEILSSLKVINDKERGGSKTRAVKETINTVPENAN